MTKNQGLLLGIALMLLFTGIALATSTTLSASSDVENMLLRLKRSEVID